MLARIMNFWLLALVLLFSGFGPAAHAGDATSFNPVPIQVVAKSSGGGVPVGTVIAWPVSRNPEDMDKWLECNGQSVSSAVYPELFAVVGAKVPDYRGLFLRGVGGASAPLGVQQGDAIRDFYADFNSFSHSAHHYGGAITRSLSSGSAIPGGGDRSYIYAGWSLKPSLQVPTAEENRPTNKAVRYFIRATP